MRSAQEVSNVQTIPEPSSPYVPFGERLVVAPCDGRFVPLPADVFTADGQWVEKGSPAGRSSFERAAHSSVFGLPGMAHGNSGRAGTASSSW